MGALLGMLLYLHGVEKNTEQVRQRPSLGRPTGLPALAMPLHYTATCTRVFSPQFYYATGGPYMGALLGMLLVPAWCGEKHRAGQAEAIPGQT